MNTKELAEKLNGIEYPPRLSREFVSEMRKAELFIVYGSSDDLIEFEGAINDEIGCYEGAKILVDRQGTLPVTRWYLSDIIDKNDDDEDFEKHIREHIGRLDHAKIVQPMWCDGEIPWTYKTEIPHETFDVMEDGKVFCRGMVIALADL